MDMGQTQPVLPPSEPPTVASPPPTPQPEKRKTPWVLILSIAAIACLLLAGGGGLLGYQVVSTNSTATAVVLGNTATAENKATNTQVAKVTGTANAHSTATGVAVATRTARAENTATGVAAKTATADVLLSGAPVPLSWKVVANDIFDGNIYNWYEYDQQDDSGTYGFDIDDGVLIAESDPKKLFYIWTRPTKLNAMGDFYTSVDISVDSADKATDFGLMFRFTEYEQTYYIVGLNNNGNYFLVRDNGRTWTYLTDGRASAINREGDNTLAVRMIDDQITVYVNGAETLNFGDDRLKRGGIGIFMQVQAYNKPVHVEFDNFYILSP